MSPSTSGLPSPLKSAQWLLAHQHDPDLRVLDCRYALSDPLTGRISYLENHIPGAIYADLETDLSGPVTPTGEGGRHPLPDPQALAAWLGSVGISSVDSGNASTVICYDDPTPSPAGTGQGFYAARAWWLLRWLGHSQVYVLDGGLPAWIQAGGAVTPDETSHAPATFTPNVQAGMLATARDVQGRAADVLLIDSRAPERYRGDHEPLDKKAGHIPGAENRPWMAALDESGHFRDGAAQAARLTAEKQVGERPTIAYCGSGVSATPNVLARELAGVPLGPHNRLYAGSWSDWVSDDSRAIETGE